MIEYITQSVILDMIVNFKCFKNISYFIYKYVEKFDLVYFLEGVCTVDNPADQQIINFLSKNFKFADQYYINRSFVDACNYGQLKLIKFLINFLIKANDFLGMRFVHIKVAKILIQSNIYSDDFMEHVFRKGNKGVAKYFIHNGKNFRFCDDAPLVIASINNQLTIVKSLLYFINIDAKNDAISWASQHDNIKVIKCLLNSGADVNVNNKEPINWTYYISVKRYLIEYSKIFHNL